MLSKSFLLSIDSKKIKYGLTRTLDLLKACGNPEKKLLSIQIIGTNGKGSTAAMLSNVLIHNSYNVGLFTSPHLVHINERIRINNKNISNDFVDFFIEKYKLDIGRIKPSFFEIMTVMSLCYFEQHRVDVAILETGLGGALDSVTAANAGMLVFTPIDYDHMSILGNSLKEIAKEKAGAIQTQEQLLISCVQRNSVKQILNCVAKENDNKILYLKPNLSNLKRFSFLQVEHQRYNALLVEYILKNVQHQYGLSCSNIIRYIEQTQWPGRIQYLHYNPSVIFDVAHNNHSLQGFISYFKKRRKEYNKAFLIIGFEQGKSIHAELPLLYDLFDSVDCTETNIRNSMSANELFALSKPLKKDIFLNQNALKIIKSRIQEAHKQDVVVILGSHYFAPHINDVYKNCFDIDIKPS